VKRDEAEQIWGMISAVYGLHPERSGEQATVWVPKLEEMDAHVVMEIVSAYMNGNGPEKLPTLVAFASEVAAILRRRSEDERAAARRELGLEPGRPRPLWYLAWEKLWKSGERTKFFPEQEQAWLEAGDTWPPTWEEPVRGANGWPVVKDGKTQYRTVVGTVIEGEEYERLIAEAAAVEQKIYPHPVDPDPECQLCEDDGVVQTGYTVVHVVRDGEVSHVRGADQMVPCPRCEKGKRLEFPLESVGPWGRDGFWQGRKWTVLRRGFVRVEEKEAATL
jgi:hypothetical protein